MFCAETVRQLSTLRRNALWLGVLVSGTGFRNEIAPRNGLLRVREFCMAEIEHFVHPEKKDHPRFGSVADNVLPLFPKSNQIGDGKIQQMSVGDAVKAGTINNETLGYFIARVALFLDSVGIRKTHLRFRQHLDTEMAHYASDCWDAEIYTSCVLWKNMLLLSVLGCAGVSRPVGF